MKIWGLALGAVLVFMAGTGGCVRDRAQDIARLEAENQRLRHQVEVCRAEAASPQPRSPEPALRAESPARDDAGPPPVQPLRSIVTLNSISQPELAFEYRNNSTRPIDAINFRAELFTNFDEPAIDQLERDNVMTGTAQDRIAPTRAARRLGVWTLHRHDHARKAIVTVTRVHFVDGTTWDGEARQEQDPRVRDGAAR